MEQGTVLRIERISPQDGQGLRTVVFLKGCPLRCAWCSTPESQSPTPEWFYKEAKCQHCSNCIAACPRAVLSFSPDGEKLLRDKDRCDNCFLCASACVPGAIGVYGKTMTVDEVMKEIRKDSLFYFYSRGGITLSGGDILLQSRFAAEILAACREDCIHTNAELDMFGKYENVADIMQFLDTCFIDIKLMDTAAHLRWTGVENTTILANTLLASADFPRTSMTVRVPLIPEITDSRQNVEATAEFCATLTNCEALEFLPYHRLGDAAYRSLARSYECTRIPPLSHEEAHRRIAFLAERKLPFALKISGKSI